MPEVIHEHITEDRASNNNGLIVGLIILAVILFLVFYYGIPALRGAASGPTVNVPDKVDVNVTGQTQPNQ